MAHRGVSVAMREHLPQPAADFAAAETQSHGSGCPDGQAARPAFATRAQAQLLDALGWQIVVSPRRDAERHAPLQCCFVLRNGRQEEAAFGYTHQTSPLDLNDPMLRAAQSRVEYFLSFLGEDRGVLLQNIPLFAFGGRHRDRIAVFGGWRFQSGVWTPFLLGPDGLAGATIQATLFAGDTAPHHMAEIYGHATKAVMPWIARLVREIETLGPHEAEADEIAVTAPDAEGLQIVSDRSGWCKARTCRPSAVTSIHQVHPNTPLFRHTDTVVAKTFWASGTDEFQFHQFGMDRRPAT